MVPESFALPLDHTASDIYKLRMSLKYKGKYEQVVMLFYYFNVNSKRIQWLKI